MGTNVQAFPEQAHDASLFETVQAFFIRATGRSVLFGGRDLELLTEWNRKGVPAKVICLGIAKKVRTARADTPPKTISACENKIRKYISRWRKNRQQGHRDDKAPSPSSANEATREKNSSPIARTLREGVEKFDRDAFSEAYRQVLEQLDHRSGYPELQYVVALEDKLVDRFVDGLSDEEQRKLDRKLEQSSSNTDLQHMSSTARREQLKAETRKVLKHQFGYISLFDAI